MKKIAIFASGNGSNAQKIAQYFANHPHINVDYLFCNNKNAGVIQKFEALNINYQLIKKSTLEENDFLYFLKSHDFDLIVLCGFLLKIPEKLIACFPQKIINIHPSLLPKFGGKGMYGIYVHEAVFEAKEKVSGITIHYVNKHYDQGQYIFQTSVDISNCNSPYEIAERVLTLEHQYFAPTIELLLSDE